MGKLSKYYCLWVAVFALAGCASIGDTLDSYNAIAIEHWNKTETGEIKGKLLVQWVGPDEFIYIPDKDAPLSFIRKQNGEVIDVITPGKMQTDGGSIPRVLWLSKDFSPWMYGPAYIIHDWLFELRHCGLEGNEKYDHKIAAQIMAEVMKTQIINRYGNIDYVSEHMATINNWNNIFLAVDGYSKKLWQHGVCEAVLDDNANQ